MQDAAKNKEHDQQAPPAPSPFDTDALADPITPDNPTGVDLREDGHPNAGYHKLRDARTAARNAERSALAEGETDFIHAGDWTRVVDQALKIIHAESKDLEVVAWLTEALTRTEGYAGAAAGFDLAQRLIADYGDALHPQADEDGKATQLAALTGLNGLGTEGALIAPLKSIPLTRSPNHGSYAVWQCEQAFELERTSDPSRRARRAEAGFASRADIDRAVAETDTDHLRRTAAELETLLASLERYQATVDSHCADDPQPTGRLQETVETCRQTLRHIAGDRIEGADAGADEPAKDAKAPTGAADDAQPPPRTHSPESRRAAVEQLAEIAAFFRRAEPHSPMSYAIEQVVRWSTLSLPDLIAELIPDENARQKYRTLTGIQAEEGE